MKTNEDKEIDLLNYDNFRKVFLNEKTRAWLVATYLKPYTDITEEELENAEYIIDKNPEFIKEEEQPMINLYVSIDKNRKITVESTTDRPHTFLKETSKTFEKLVEHNFTDIKFIKIVFDKYNIFESDEPILNFKFRDQYGHVDENFWYESIHVVLENCKKIVDRDNFRKDVVKGIKNLAEKYDFIKYYEYTKELSDEINKALKDDDKEKLKELFTKMTSEGATISMIASVTKLEYEEVEEILNS